MASVQLSPTGYLLSKEDSRVLNALPISVVKNFFNVAPNDTDDQVLMDNKPKLLEQLDNTFHI